MVGGAVRHECPLLKYVAPSSIHYILKAYIIIGKEWTTLVEGVWTGSYSQALATHCDGPATQYHGSHSACHARFPMRSRY